MCFAIASPCAGTPSAGLSGNDEHPALAPGRPSTSGNSSVTPSSLVQTMLGHSNVNTTKDTYLEPFRGLDVKLLLEHGVSELQAETLLDVLRSNPRVRVEDDMQFGGERREGLHFPSPVTRRRSTIFRRPGRTWSASIPRPFQGSRTSRSIP